MKPWNKTLLAASAAVAMIALSPLARSQRYASKPLTMIVAFPAGAARM